MIGLLEMEQPLPTARPAGEPSRKTGGGGRPGPPREPPPPKPPPPAEAGPEKARKLMNKMPAAKPTALGFRKSIIICLPMIGVFVRPKQRLISLNNSTLDASDLVHGCKYFFAEAHRFLNVENRFNLAVFFEGSADSVERIVAMAWLAPFIEKGKVGQG